MHTRSNWRHPAPRCTCCPAATTIARHNGSWYSVSSPITAYVESLDRRRTMKTRLVSTGVASLCALLLAGCGLADVGAAAATEGASAAEQAKQAKKTQEKVEKQIEDAQQAAADARAKAEADSQ